MRIKVTIDIENLKENIKQFKAYLAIVSMSLDALEEVIEELQEENSKLKAVLEINQERGNC